VGAVQSIQFDRGDSAACEEAPGRKGEWGSNAYNGTEQPRDGHRLQQRHTRLPIPPFRMARLLFAGKSGIVMEIVHAGYVLNAAATMV